MIVKKGHNPNVDSYSAFFDNKKVKWATPLLLISDIIHVSLDETRSPNHVLTNQSLDVPDFR